MEVCLLIGPPSSGKTLLTKKLQSLNSKDDSCINPSTVPTVGTNLVNLQLARKQELTIRELGGAMSPLWSNYFQDCRLLIYVIDLSNRMQISAACILLLTVLTSQKLNECHILVLLNKVDLATTMSRFEFESLFRWDDIVLNTRHKLSIKEISAVSGQGLTDVYQWLQQNAR